MNQGPLVLVSGLRLLASLAVIWLALCGVHLALPFIRPGHELIYEAKLDYIHSQLHFPASAGRRVVIFGDSKVLSGFVPSLFDSLVSDGTCCYNLGLPDATHFVSQLEQLIARDQVPTHVLLTVPWGSEDSSEGFTMCRDGDIMQRVFPFRQLPRDASLFLMRSITRGGPRAYYRHCEELVSGLRADRGYFFIEGQSHFPDHRLPNGFSLASDLPHAVASRTADLRQPIFQKLVELGNRQQIQLWFVPIYYRAGEYASPSATNIGLESALRPYPCFRVLGPDYYLLPSECFSDPVHLNRKGAREYTGRLAELCRDAMRSVDHD